jgi:LAS superfamily LD-carboxypeptidase LdcB
MPTVPVYQRSERSAPILRQNLTAQASGDDFGAQIGRGVQAVAQGVDSVGDAVTKVNALKDESLIRQRRNDYMEARRNLMYDPENGYMTKSGQAAIDARPKFEEDLKGLSAKYAEGLNGGQQNLFKRTVEPLEQDGLQSGIVHNANELKTQIAADATASSANFLNEALVNYSNPEKADKYLAAGALEIKNLAEKEGWSADVLEQKQRDYISGATQKMALRIASTGQGGPLLAKAYIEKNAGRLSADDKFELDVKMKPIIDEAEATANATDFLSRKRGQGQPDIVKEVVDAAGKPDNSDREEPGRPAIANTPISASGPSRVRSFLISRAPGKGAAAVDGLDESFAGNLAAMIEDAPPRIREGLQIMSGHRSVERQTELWNQALAKYGSVSAARKWVAPPGRSKHNEGKAVDLMWNGQTLKAGSAPQDVIDYVHANANKYGLYFPLGNEDWHIEPEGSRGTTVASKVDGPVPRSNAPSYDEIQTYLDTIQDPTVRKKTEERIYQTFEQQNKVREMAQTSARQQLWEMWERNGVTPDQAPTDLRIAAGNTAVDSINDSIRSEREGNAVTDQNVLFGLNRMAAEDPTRFKNLDLTDYYPKLAREDRKSVNDSQNKLLTGDVEAQNNGSVYNAAYKQAEQSLASVGLTTTGIPQSKPQARQEMETQISRFQNALKVEIDQFRTQNSKTPNYDETQTLINSLLMKSVYTQPRGAWSPMRLFDDGTDEVGSGFMFERSGRPDGSDVKPVVEFEKIPPEWQTTIRTALTERNGKAPDRQEIEAEYAAIVLQILGSD